MTTLDQYKPPGCLVSEWFPPGSLPSDIIFDAVKPSSNSPPNLNQIPPKGKGNNTPSMIHQKIVFLSKYGIDHTHADDPPFNEMTPLMLDAYIEFNVFYNGYFDMDAPHPPVPPSPFDPHYRNSRAWRDIASPKKRPPPDWSVSKKVSSKKSKKNDVPSPPSPVQDDVAFLPSDDDDPDDGDKKPAAAEDDVAFLPLDDKDDDSDDGGKKPVAAPLAVVPPVAAPPEAARFTTTHGPVPQLGPLQRIAGKLIVLNYGVDEFPLESTQREAVGLSKLYTEHPTYYRHVRECLLALQCSPEVFGFTNPGTRYRKSMSLLYHLVSYLSIRFLSGQCEHFAAYAPLYKKGIIENWYNSNPDDIKEVLDNFLSNCLGLEQKVIAKCIKSGNPERFSKNLAEGDPGPVYTSFLKNVLGIRPTRKMSLILRNAAAG